MHDCQGVCFPCRIDKLFTSVSILCILSVHCNIVRGHPILHCCLELHSALLFKSELYSTLIPKLSSALKSELCTTLDSELIRGHPISHLCCLPFHSIFKPKLCSTLPGKSVLPLYSHSQTLLHPQVGPPLHFHFWGYHRYETAHIQTPRV